MKRYTIVNNRIVLDRMSSAALPIDIPIELVTMAHIARCFNDMGDPVGVSGVSVRDAGRELVESLALILSPSEGSAALATRAVRYAMFRPNLELYFQAAIGAIGNGTESIDCRVDALYAAQKAILIDTLGSRLITFI